MKIFKSLKTLSDLVVLPHSVFALPFALASLLVATHGSPSLSVLGWVVACMVLARTSAMAYNRLVDADIDAKNPRTANRDIPKGRVTREMAAFIMVVSGLGFVGACYPLNPLVFKLSPLALVVLYFYSHTKRFTWTSHLFLGLALGIAPVGAWLAAKGEFSVTPFWLTGAVICFLAGFDILYATQDEAFDKKNGLQSWVVRWGIPASLLASRFFHVCMLGFLAGFGVQAGFHMGYFAGLGLVAAALIFQHLYAYKWVKTGKSYQFALSPQMMALNGWISVIYFCVVGANLWL